MAIELVLLISRQGKVRLSKQYKDVMDKKEKQRVVREVSNLVLARQAKVCNFVAWRGKKIVYKRYASLYFICVVEPEDNELIVLEQIHHFVEALDKYFGNVCELDIIFNFHKAYFILDEIFIGGNMFETSKKEIVHAVCSQDDMAEEDLRRETPLNQLKLNV